MFRMLYAERYVIFPWFHFTCRNQEFQQSVKELKEKAEELKGVTEDLKVR